MAVFIVICIVFCALASLVPGEPFTSDPWNRE